jgi:hypothetical protein
MKIIFCILLGMTSTLPAHAEEFTDNAQHMSVINSDSRQLLNYPPDVRAHALANMRRHLQALAEIMDAFAKAKYAEAAEIADTRLGMDSPGAAGCRPDTMKMDMKTMPMLMSESDHLNHQMALLMPEKMRELGQNMHRSANEFAVKARDADKDSKNVTVAAVALAKIAQQCVACHESYRMQ